MLGIGLRDSRFGFVLSAAQPIDWVNAALMRDRQLRFPHVFEWRNWLAKAEKSFPSDRDGLMARCR
jgi:hypothetical protein